VDTGLGGSDGIDGLVGPQQYIMPILTNGNSCDRLCNPDGYRQDDRSLWVSQLLFCWRKSFLEILPFD